jgi:CRP/FNR family cyclic AMP-dependent transcriptional regulator
MGWFGNSQDRLSGKTENLRNKLFGDLTARELRIIHGFMHKRHFLAGEVIFDAGEQGQALYVIDSGKVAICLDGQVEKPLAELQTYDFFGELGLLDDCPRSAQARAVVPTELSVLFRQDFESLMAAHARVASKISLRLAQHLGTRMRLMLASVPGGDVLQ